MEVSQSGSVWVLAALLPAFVCQPWDPVQTFQLSHSWQTYGDCGKELFIFEKIKPLYEPGISMGNQDEDLKLKGTPQL